MFEIERRWPPDMNQLQREMDRYLQHVTQKHPRTVIFSKRTWQPALDLYEREDAVVAVFDLSGVSASDLELTLTATSLTLRGERKAQGTPGMRRYSVMEIPFGPFERSAQLPAIVSPDDARAEFEAGLLQVTMPKAAGGGPKYVVVRIA